MQLCRPGHLVGHELARGGRHGEPGPDQRGQRADLLPHGRLVLLFERHGALHWHQGRPRLWHARLRPLRRGALLQQPLRHPVAAAAGRRPVRRQRGRLLDGRGRHRHRVPGAVEQGQGAGLLAHVPPVGPDPRRRRQHWPQRQREPGGKSLVHGLHSLHRHPGRGAPRRPAAQ